MKHSFILREAKLDDLGGLMHLLYQLSPLKEGEEKPGKKKLEKTLEEILSSSNHFLFVLEKDSEIIGTGTLLVQPNLSHSCMPYAHIENVVVDREHRGEGNGEKIMEKLLKKARERNCYKVILNCEKHNISFYESCGLKKTSEVEMRIDL